MNRFVGEPQLPRLKYEIDLAQLYAHYSGQGTDFTGLYFCKLRQYWRTYNKRLPPVTARALFNVAFAPPTTRIQHPSQWLPKRWLPTQKEQPKTLLLVVKPAVAERGFWAWLRRMFNYWKPK